MRFQKEIDETITGLKDFQKATVNYAFEQFKNGQKRYLIADEVGLGKTIVAKGIIAKLYQQYQRKNADFVVVYICSNRALAKQNISKLSFLQNYDGVVEYEEDNDRLSDLAYVIEEKTTGVNFKIKAFTPATSFDNKTSAGKQKERILLYRLLKTEFRDRKVSLKWFLKGGNRISNDNWQKRIEEAETFDKKGINIIKPGLESKFIKRIKKPLTPLSKAFSYLEKGEKSLYHILIRVLVPRKQNVSFTKDSYVYDTRNFRLIAELRYCLNEVCADFLKADIFVLDEFQRFSNLIQAQEPDDEEKVDPGSEIARKIFLKKDSKILLLSATPFKAFTNFANEIEGENHYTGFRKVLRFLLNNTDDAFGKNLDEKNHEFFRALQDLNNNAFTYQSVEEVKQKIEEIYRSCISRTERTLVEENHKDFEKKLDNLTVNKNDIIDFLVLDSIVKKVNESSAKNRSLPIPIEYVKSSPFPLSFLQDYEHMKAIEEELKDNLELQKFVKSAKRAFVPRDRINDFKPLLPESTNETTPNPKLRLLYDGTIRNGGWKLLWIPPSINYYYPGKSSAFISAKNFTKTLIFSAWKMVPRMVSSLVSYEAERYSVGKFLQNKEKAEIKYFASPRLPQPRLVFKKGLKNMNNFLLTYPSVFLSEIYHPAQNLLDKKSLSEIRSNIKTRIKNRLIELGVQENKYGNENGDWQKWNWFALFLLDRETENIALTIWMKKSFEENSSLNSEENFKSDEKGAKKEHFEEMKKCLNDKNYFPNLSILTTEGLDKVCDFLTELAIGSPAVCSLRTLNTLFNNEDGVNLQCAYNLGIAFNSLFNKPESIAIIDNKFDESESYYSNVIEYCIEGNIQSMLDEFIYQLKDSSGMKSAVDCTQLVCDILSVSASSQELKTEASLLKASESFKIRTHYAVPFGLGSSSDLKSGKRQIKVREAFNSPFRPFVLTSTSIGQEGLDFHYYCNKIIHWNLPTNPIDLEQREGRIKRYKSLSIRKSIVKRYSAAITDVKNVWEDIYQIAIKQKNECICDLEPFWYLGNDSNIQTIIPLYPFSKDVEKLDYIKNVLAHYRLTFGQPRQEELIYALSILSDADISDLDLKKLTINLSPITY